jgi:short-subunit dehydrogenase
LSRARAGLALFGAALGAALAWRTLDRARHPGTYRRASSGETAVVTGASAGLGAAFARRLAADGYGVVLIARRLDRLQSLAGELARQHGVSAEAVAADLARPEDVLRVEARVAGLEKPALLVNNAGFGTVGRFADLPIGRQADMIQVHAAAATRLARAILPGLLARRSGAIINVSSLAAFLPAPGNVTYAATKAYLSAFSQSLQAELAGSGVAVQALCPGMTATELHRTPEYQAAGFEPGRIPRWLWMPPEAVVDISLRELGRSVVCIPGAKNQLIAGLRRVLPAGLLAKGAEAAMLRTERPVAARSSSS